MEILTAEAWSCLPPLSFLFVIAAGMVALGITLSGVLYIAYYGFLSPLTHIPGPFVARFTRLWLAYHAWKGDFHIVLTREHEKYGPIIRTGPNEVLTTSPEAIKRIYGAGSKFEKSEFYVPIKGIRKWDRFGERDSIVHRNNRRLVNNIYATSSLIELEPYIDSAIQHFVNILDSRRGQTLDFGTFLQLFAFDVIGEVTFSRRFGLMDIGKETESLKIIKRAARFTSWVGQVPWVYKLHQSLSPIIGNRLAMNARNGYIRDFTMEQAQSRILRGSDHRDMLSKLIEVNQEKPTEFDNMAVISMAASNVFAGSDTTAIALRAIFYHMFENPRCMKKLLSEIDEVVDGADVSSPVTFEQVNRMPYLQAVMQEALRIHPIIGQSLPRVVPEEGVDIEGIFIPHGTIVGTSPYVLGRSESIYGEDAKTFRPERWLEEDRGDLLRGFLAFGGASRICIGKSLSWMEMSKVVPTVLRRFDLGFSKTDFDWEERT